jgi:hypothetical protein
MSRKNFIHQADLLFSNANGGAERVTTTTVREPVETTPVREPSRPVVNEKERKAEIDAKIRKELENQLREVQILKEKERAIKDKLNAPILSREPERPVVSEGYPIPEPIIPILSREPERPVVSEGYPIPEPIIPILSREPERPVVSEGYPIPEPPKQAEPSTPTINIDTTRVDSVGNGGIGTAISGGGNSDSKKEILKKDFIPLLLTVAGLLIIAFKPIKQ